MSSRSQVAGYLAEQLVGNDPAKRQEAVTKVAAWLKQTKRTKEVNHLAQDVALSLMNTQGYVYARVITARNISADDQAKIIKSIKLVAGASEVEAVFLVDKSIIGGVKVQLPNGTLDASIERKLAKIIENVG